MAAIDDGTLIVLGFILLLFIGAVYLGITWVMSDSPQIAAPKTPQIKKKGVLSSCPICGRRVQAGEQVYAQYINLSSGQKLVEIKGCDNCLGTFRYCPRCGVVLEPDGVVYAKLVQISRTEKDKGNKDRLHIEGCMACYKR